MTRQKKRYVMSLGGGRGGWLLTKPRSQGFSLLRGGGGGGFPSSWGGGEGGGAQFPTSERAGTRLALTTLL